MKSSKSRKWPGLLLSSVEFWLRLSLHTAAISSTHAARTRTCARSSALAQEHPNPPPSEFRNPRFFRRSGMFCAQTTFFSMGGWRVVATSERKNRRTSIRRKKRCKSDRDVVKKSVP
ncbi:hypothetical protein SCHPADRAFT_196068 [Schizopora paradoxa]|uniref:Secreted protein n=1 Tax=Schizopora paradoxa TaxID=27342 RepID=A0A0H2S5A2_9AGAM|nr:hypothetical protein SCHPADRAFT_196068 [Schizopora paradoxa]